MQKNDLMTNDAKQMTNDAKQMTNYFALPCNVLIFKFVLY
jgi:hypothetical protein